LHLSLRSYLSGDAGKRRFGIFSAETNGRRFEKWRTNFLYFIVGGIVVVVALLAFLYMGGHLPGQNKTVNVTVEAPKVNP
jgi:hypothetical protein